MPDSLSNIRDVEKYAIKATEKYNGLIVTSDSIAEAKKTVAQLRAFEKSINAKRISDKKAYLIPFEAYEAEIKRVANIMAKPIAEIDAQVKAFGEREKQAKYNEIEKEYNKYITESLRAVLPLDKILPEKWANKSESIEDICIQISDEIHKAQLDVTEIRAIGTPHENALIETYFKTLDLSCVFAEKSRLEKNDLIIEEMKKKQAAQQAMQPATSQSNTQQPSAAQPNTQQQTTPNHLPQVVDHVPEQAVIVEVKKDVEVIFYATTQVFRNEMKALTIKHGITYGGIKK